MRLKDALDRHVHTGHLARIDQGDLHLYNYTPKCVYDNIWTAETRIARGLVIDRHGRIIARPYEKFWNVNERPETHILALPKDVPELADKLDGSLLIVFFDPYTSQWRVVTRGSWKNTQTDYAHSWLDAHASRLDPRYTHCFELVAPWNRIVVVYDTAKMILTGLIETESGYDSTYAQVNQYAQERKLDHVAYRLATLGTVQTDDSSIVNFEGHVARWPGGMRVKIKYEIYRRLHKVLTQLSVKGIWESLATQTPIPMDHVPSEFVAWFEDRKNEIQDAYRQIEDRAKAIFDSIDKTRMRKEIATDFVKHGPLAGILFSMLDGYDYSQTIWKMCKPTSHKTFQKDEP
jgi:RNA ligase